MKASEQSNRNIQLSDSWKAVLNHEFDRPYFSNLVQFLRNEKALGKTIYPPGPKIFASMDLLPFEDVKVVILGQDPYHGPRQANGLCFSVYDGVPHPPSLVNIFKEIETDLGISYPVSGDLSKWAEQGVLLLNATLTVEAHRAGSHQNKGWELFTDAIVEALSSKRQDLIFMLWGGYARRKGAKIDSSRHLILQSGHPSPLSANKGYWFGNRHFSKTNDFLRTKNLGEINWAL